MVVGGLLIPSGVDTARAQWIRKPVLFGVGLVLGFQMPAIVT